ncbi:MAG TPA: hypothetical protein VFA71_09955 [Terriglobales bacterium]|nr:hypothetical protein [Terriglobales bacterium]
MTADLSNTELVEIKGHAILAGKKLLCPGDQLGLFRVFLHQFLKCADRFALLAFLLQAEAKPVLGLGGVRSRLPGHLRNLPVDLDGAIEVADGLLQVDSFLQQLGTGGGLCKKAAAEKEQQQRYPYHHVDLHKSHFIRV